MLNYLKNIKAQKNIVAAYFRKLAQKNFHVGWNGWGGREGGEI